MTSSKTVPSLSARSLEALKKRLGKKAPPAPPHAQISWLKRQSCIRGGRFRQLEVNELSSKRLQNAWHLNRAGAKDNALRNLRRHQRMEVNNH